MEEPGLEISIIIPTYGREQILINTIESLLLLRKPGRELLIVDQTLQHDSAVESKLREWSDSKVITWLRCNKPSVMAAMNIGLRHARGRIALFLDDDIDPDSGLIDAHLEGHKQTYEQNRYALVAGRVIQPWAKERFSPFDAANPAEVEEFMGGNFSVDRVLAISLGGFDQNFRYAAYQYEREFADRLRASGARILYWPSAVIHHLKATEGGVRSYGSHLTTWRPGHSLGAYYYIFTSKEKRTQRIVKRLVHSIKTRFHLTHPWYVPPTLVAEFTGLFLASILWSKGPQLIH
jgi:GT2 family glycosyltransferase